MDYKIIMPVLSDTMDKGKLVRWRVHKGDMVHKGDVIAEVESDKAIMEVQSFKDGVVKKLLVKEGDEVPVKAPIAIIDTEAETAQTEQQKQPEIVQHPKEQSTSTQKPKAALKEPTPTAAVPPVIEELLQTPAPKLAEGDATPAAKKRAAELGIDIKGLQAEGKLPKPAHLKEIETEAFRHYFTPKALRLLQEYQLDAKLFTLDHKINAAEVENYIKEYNIPKTVSLSKNRIAVMKNVQNAATKPVYFIFEEFDIKEYEGIKLTSLLIKKLAKAMQKHPLTRAKLEGTTLKIYPHSNISVAVAKGDELYMVVCKRAEEKSLQEIDAWVRGLKERTFTADELTGSTFGISNLGMFGVQRFSAMINQSDVGIAAFGAVQNGKISVTFTFDHRVLNGVDAALFVHDAKEIFKGDDNV